VTITSAEEQSIVYTLVKNGAKDQYWLGAERNGSGWKWITGETWAYDNWANGEPNDSAGEEDYVHIII
jgi:hypothetical protein